MKTDTFHTDGTDTGIAMRATEKGRSDSLIAMVQGDRRDALVIDSAVGTPDAKRVAASLAKVYAQEVQS